jgi:hypothetical protein
LKGKTKNLQTLGPPLNGFETSGIAQLQVLYSKVFQPCSWSATIL